MKPILAATDFSPIGNQAVVRACELAAASGAPLILLHVLDEPEQAEAARSALQALAAGLGIDASLRLASGPVREVLQDQADACDAGLLVLGARGRSLVEGLLLGSTAERMAEHCRRPLLIVRQSASLPYRRLLVPVDFSARSAQAIALARQLLPQAGMTLLHTFELPFEGRLRHAGLGDGELASLLEQALQQAGVQMQAFAASQKLEGLGVRSLILHGDPVSHTLAQAQPEQHDLLLVGRRGQGLLAELLLGSVTRNLLQHAAIDTLVF
jgi:nucleotide-binding universal stress UspA family protein